MTVSVRNGLQVDGACLSGQALPLASVMHVCFGQPYAMLPTSCDHWSGVSKAEVRGGRVMHKHSLCICGASRLCVDACAPPACIVP